MVFKLYSTYIEKDVRQIINIGDVISFQIFLRLCAARIGNILNYSELARDCDISPNTAKSWISLLEARYIIKLLEPYYKNFNKRVIKSPKLYFYDTGIVCSLLGIKDPQELYTHPMRGHLFESLIISELFKNYYNQAKKPLLYFWRDIQGHEVDCIIEKSYDKLIPLEIKSGMTINQDFFKSIIEWQKISGQNDSAYIVYAGQNDQIRSAGHLLAWNNIKKITI